MINNYQKNPIYCDKCNKVIEKVSNGWVQWLDNENKQFYGFKITHHKSFSPLKKKTENGCYFYFKSADLNDLPLSSFYDIDGMGYFLGMGNKILESGLPQIESRREFLKIFMRIHLPYYEQVSREVDLDKRSLDQKIFMPRNLRLIIKNYKTADF